MTPLNTRLRATLQSVYSHDSSLREGAIKDLVREALSMEQALQFYADPDNWIDGKPMVNDKHGLQTEEDCGFEARWALHLVDVSFGVYFKISQEDLANAVKPAISDTPGDGRRGDGAVEEPVDPCDAYPVWQRLPDGRPGDGSQN